MDLPIALNLSRSNIEYSGIVNGSEEFGNCNNDDEVRRNPHETEFENKWRKINF